MQRSWESFLSKAGRDIAGIKCSAHKNDKVSVNVSPLLRATAGASVLAEGGGLYNQAELYPQEHDNMRLSVHSLVMMCSCCTGTPLPPLQLHTPRGVHTPLPYKVCGTSFVLYGHVCLAQFLLCQQ